MAEASTTTRTLKDLEGSDAAKTQETSVDDDTFDWSWGSDVNVDTAFDHAGTVTTARGQKWREEMEQLREKITRYEPQVVITIRNLRL